MRFLFNQSHHVRNGLCVPFRLSSSWPQQSLSVCVCMRSGQCLLRGHRIRQDPIPSLLPPIRFCDGGSYNAANILILIGNKHQMDKGVRKRNRVSTVDNCVRSCEPTQELQNENTRHKMRTRKGAQRTTTAANTEHTSPYHPPGIRLINMKDGNRTMMKRHAQSVSATKTAQASQLQCCSTVGI